jgi:hypothetical protein
MYEVFCKSQKKKKEESIQNLPIIKDMSENRILSKSEVSAMHLHPYYSKTFYCSPKNKLLDAAREGDLSGVQNLLKFTRVNVNVKNDVSLISKGSKEG